jgi:hypothetical protein
MISSDVVGLGRNEKGEFASVIIDEIREDPEIIGRV